MKKVTLGKFIPGNSIIHKMNPQLKLIVNILLIVMVSMTQNMTMLFMISTPVLMAFMVSGLSKWTLFRTLNTTLFIGIFIFIINTVFNVAYITNEEGIEIIKDGYTDYGRWWRFTITNVSIKLTIVIMLRIYIMILTTTLLTATTSPLSLTRAFEDVLWPLKLLFLPVHIIALIISIALRFIPTLLEESQRIMKAQSSRGVDFHNGNMKAKAKSILTLVIPLFVSAFAKADDLANAMETRGYNPYVRRTRYNSYPIKWYDVFIMLLFIGILVALILNNNSVGVLELPDWHIDKWNLSFHKWNS